MNPTYLMEKSSIHSDLTAARQQFGLSKKKTVDLELEELRGKGWIGR